MTNLFTYTVPQFALKVMEFHNAELWERGLCLPNSITEEQVQAIVESLAFFEEGRQWYWGDLLNKCEAKWGETYAQFVPWTGRKVQTLMNWKYVASRIPPERRMFALEWTKYQAVADLSPAEQLKWLALAEQNEWQREDLRAALKGAIPDGHEPPNTKSANLPPAVESVVLPSPDEAFEVLEQWIEESQSPEQRAQRIQSIRVHLPVEEVEDIHDQPEPEGEWIPGGVVFSDEDINELAELLNGIVACAERVQEETRRPSPDYAVIYDAIEPVQDKAERTLELLYSKGRRV